MESTTSPNYTRDSSHKLDILVVQDCKKEGNAVSESGWRVDTMTSLRRSFRKLTNSGMNMEYHTLVPITLEEGKKPVKKQIEQFQGETLKLIEDTNPRFIIALGPTVTAALTGKDKFSKWVGRKVEIGKHVVIPMYHPDAAQKSKKMQREYESQVQNVVAVLQGKIGNLDACDYELVTDEDDIVQYLKALSEMTDSVQSFDYETQDFDPDKGVPGCLSISYKHGQGFCFYFYDHVTKKSTITQRIREAIRGWMLSSVPKVAHNAKFEIKWTIVHFGVEPANLVGDTQQMFHLINEQASSGLKDLAYQFTDMGGYDTPMQEFLDKGNKHLDASADFILPYAAGDADCTLRIYHVLRAKISKDVGLSWVERNVVNPATTTLARIEIRGMRIDFEHAKVVERELQKDLSDLNRRIDKFPEVIRTVNRFKLKNKKMTRINFKSPIQVQHLLFTECNLPVQRLTASKQPSTDGKVLEILKDMHPVVDAIVTSRSHEYEIMELGVMREKRRYNDTIFSDLIQDYVVTGRLSSRDPNLQNIPGGSKVKECFTSRWTEGCLMQSDYDQLELRLVGGEAMDEMFIETYRTGKDLHMETALRLFGLSDPKKVTSEMRSFAKRINFGVVYGITKHGLARQLNKSEEECEEMLERYWKDHPRIRRWMKQNVSEAYDTLEIRNRLGRVRHIPDIVSNVRWIRESAERTASNSKIQSLGADLTMWSMGTVDNVLVKKKVKSMVIGQIHDSLMLDVHPKEIEQVAEIVHTTMVSVANRKFSFLNIPLKAKIESAYRWSDLKEMKVAA